MRTVFCNLNYDLFIKGCIIDSQECECSHQKEDVTHFLLHCPIFNAPRMIMINNISSITMSLSVIPYCLYDNKTLIGEDNLNVLCIYVCAFIVAT